MLVILAWLTPGTGEQVPTRRGELRVVDRSPFNWHLCHVERYRAPH
jgi:hypothetical protein